MAQTVRVEGLRELERALNQLPKAAVKAILRRVLKKRSKPIGDTAKQRAPKDEGDLEKSIGVSTKLSPRQRRAHRKSGGKDTVDMFVGAGPLPQAHMSEFGSAHNAPKPFMRPAWDQHKAAVLDGIGKDIGNEIFGISRYGLDMG